MKTMMDIEQDIFDVCVDFFNGKVNGKVYKSEMRPVDSNREDVVIAVSNADTLQMQNGSAYVLIYVPDIVRGSHVVPDKGRLQELCAMDEDILQALYERMYSHYDLELGRATRPVKTQNMNQHFVSIKIDFRINQ